MHPKNREVSPLCSEKGCEAHEKAQAHLSAKGKDTGDAGVDAEPVKASCAVGSLTLTGMVHPELPSGSPRPPLVQRSHPTVCVRLPLSFLPESGNVLLSLSLSLLPPVCGWRRGYSGWSRATDQKSYS